MLTAAVVGCGVRGSEHRRALQAIPDVELVGAVDVSPARRAAATAEWGVPAFATVGELLARTRPSIVVLATPAPARFPLVEQLLHAHAGTVRALVLEKPMALGLKEAHRILELCDEAGVYAVVGHQLRFCPEFVAMKEAVDRGELGRLQTLFGWCHGNLMEQGPHLLDLVCWLAGNRRVLWVMSQQCDDGDTLDRLAPAPVARGDDPAHPAPPWMVHHVAFEDGLRATIETGPLHQRSRVFLDVWLQQRILVTGSEGLAEAQAAGYFRLLRQGAPWRDLPGTLAGYQAATRAFHQELRDVLLQGGAHRSEAREALRSLELMVACAESAVDGRLVAWPPDPERDSIHELSARRARGPRAARRPARGAPGRSARPTEEPEFSVVVTLPDHRGHAIECLESWTRGQDFPRERYETIVVGNGTEPTLEDDVRGRLGAQDRLLRVSTINEIEMYHRGAEAARGRWLLFTEPHCIAEPECLAELSAYLGRTSYAGACLRSVSPSHETMARLEDCAFKEGFATWSRPGDWRKVILRGVAIRRDAYREVGGFEYRFERFAESLLAATLHARGFALGYASGATVRHFDTTSFAELFPAVANFTRGECAYRAAKPADDEPYFGTPPEWLDRHRLRRDLARETARAAWRGLCLDAWDHGVPGLRFALSMLRETAQAVPAAVFGAHPRVLAAWLGLGLARVRLAWLSVGEAARYRAYRRLLDAMVHVTRIDYLARDAGLPAAGPPAVCFEVAEIPDDRLAGFHPRETWQGRSFRWMSPVGTLWLDVPPASYEVVLDTEGLGGSVPLEPVGISWNGRGVKRATIRCQGGRVSFPVSEGSFVSGRLQTLTLTHAPLRRRGTPEPRRLGLPLVRATFVPAGTP